MSEVASEGGRKTTPRTFASERLLFRCPTKADSASINAAIRASWSELSQWMDRAQGDPPTLAHTEARVAEREAGFENRTEFSFGAFDRDSGAFVGMVSLPRVDWDLPKGELGYWLATGKTGVGYAAEAACALADFAFSLGLLRLEIRCDVLNTRSRHVAKRANFLLEGILRSETRNPQGKLRDTCVYAKINADR